MGHTHPLVRKAFQQLSSATLDSYGLLIPSRNRPCLNVRVSQSSLDRALTFMDRLLGTFETQGYSTKLSTEIPAATLVLVEGEELKIRLLERSERVDRVSSEASPHSLLQSPWTFKPKGVLTFMIEEYTSAISRKNWSDGRRHRLEEYTDEIVAALPVVARALTEQRTEWEERERTLREEQRRRFEEERRLKLIEALSESWSKSQYLRAFVKACEADFVKRLGRITPDSAEARWLEWARGQADRLDPFENGGVTKTIVDEFGMRN
jgi:hypothetical protein